MAIRKKTSADEQGKKISKWVLGKVFKKSLTVITLILLGGMIFNLDRMGSTGTLLSEYREYLPSFITRFFPEKNIPEGKSAPEDNLEGTVISVYDGDTMTFTAEKNGELQKFKVRFFGIDAPEASQEYGVASRDALREKILNKKVNVSVVSVDRYGRSVGKVYCADNYINLQMVTEGNAWYYPDYAAHEQDLERAQKEAQGAKRGLWKNPEAQPPWMYRKENSN
ncbi:MAG: hypothetical protein E7058_08820 [Lentisphaerae bacterium]|nr:hypothetical protein [Lentisphaerota bacterium]